MQRNVVTEQATESLLQGSKRVLFQAKRETLLVQLPQNPAALHLRDPEQGRDRRGIQRPFVPPARVSQCNNSCSRHTPQQLGFLVDPPASRAKQLGRVTFSSLASGCGWPTDPLRLRFLLGWQSLWSGSHGKSRLGLVADTSGSSSTGRFAVYLEHPSTEGRRWAGAGLYC
jgi:hypothetical protein